ncbi:hypothetical protein EDD80_102302 [Anseongella ginsenosidimutans]|uniref:Uncharacterized protein n=1 Tax=Anseongella ginsenosidimutans TaxID=496056 RepID=A0A4R3KUK9_9SPHI|nr:DUF6358 family protein [Anseongella ginsenosidimutans]QEC51746.1 hypothetical protein FRZ59_04925 [Anseongella ginsenosidimutans]TCS89109.1 hypothetical protein EDD80_102302 [Anseongella ginsenosidimutans]
MTKKLITNVGINVMLFLSFILLMKVYDTGNAAQLIAAFLGFIMFVVLKIVYIRKVRRMQKEEK